MRALAKMQCSIIKILSAAHGAFHLLATQIILIKNASANCNLLVKYFEQTSKKKIL